MNDETSTGGGDELKPEPKLSREARYEIRRRGILKRIEREKEERAEEESDWRTLFPEIRHLRLDSEDMAAMKDGLNPDQERAWRHAILELKMLAKEYRQQRRATNLFGCGFLLMVLWKAFLH